MRITLLSYAAFVGVSLMLWNGCLGHRSNTAPAAAAVAPIVATR